MRNRIRPRKLMLACALALLLAGLSAPSASAHAGWGTHFFCNKLVPARGYCPGSSGIQVGNYLGVSFSVWYPGKSPIEICAIVDVYRRSPAAFVKRLKTCGMSSGQSVTMNAGYTSAAYPADYSPAKYYDIALVYNRSSYAHTIGAAHIGNAWY